MSTPKTRLRIACAIVAGLALNAVAHAETFQFGTTPTAAELAKFFAIPPDGRGLPPGRGTAAEGKKLFADGCVMCHGDKMQGIPTFGIGGDRLIGGRGTLATKTPVKTVESYWPYATTLFDYIKRAMPFQAPGSLADNEVYSLVAYILSESNIIKSAEVMDARSLPAVVMPNHDGFIADSRPEIELYR